MFNHYAKQPNPGTCRAINFISAWNNNTVVLLIYTVTTFQNKFVYAFKLMMCKTNLNQAMHIDKKQRYFLTENLRSQCYWSKSNLLVLCNLSLLAKIGITGIYNNG